MVVVYFKCKFSNIDQEHYIGVLWNVQLEFWIWTCHGPLHTCFNVWFLNNFNGNYMVTILT